MCEYCITEPKYLIYEESKRTFGIQACEDHRSQAIDNLSQRLSNSRALIIVERVD